MFGVVWQYNKITCSIFVHKFPVKYIFRLAEIPGQVYRTSLPDKFTGQVYRTSLPDKFTGQVYRTIVRSVDCYLQALDRCHFWLNKEYCFTKRNRAQTHT